jgi:hypothetical protein
MLTTYVNPHVDAIWQENLGIARTDLLLAYAGSPFLSPAEWAEAAGISPDYANNLIRNPYTIPEPSSVDALWRATPKGKKQGPLNVPDSSITLVDDRKELKWIIEHHSPDGEILIIDNIGVRALIVDAENQVRALGQRQEVLTSKGIPFHISYDAFASARNGHFPNQKRSLGSRTEKLDNIIRATGEYLYASHPADQRADLSYQAVIKASLPETQRLTLDDLKSFAEKNAVLNSAIRGKQKRFIQAKRIATAQLAAQMNELRADTKYIL